MVLDAGTEGVSDVRERSRIRTINNIALGDLVVGTLVALLISWSGQSLWWAVYIAICFSPSAFALAFNAQHKHAKARRVPGVWAPVAIATTAFLLGPHVHMELGFAVSLTGTMAMVPHSDPWRNRLIAWHFLMLGLVAAGGVMVDAPFMISDDFGQPMVLGFVAVTMGNIAVRIGTLVEEAERRDVELEAARVEAERASAAKSTFLAHMSHELRTPLGGVIGLTDLLLDSHLTSEQVRLARQSRRSADHLMSLINQILDLAKVESGKLELEQKPFNLRRGIDEAVAMVQHRAADRGLNLHVDTTALQLSDWRIGDDLRVRQIIVNLLANAIKFTDKGSVSLVAADSSENVVQIEVQDTGIGIPAEEIERIFEPFIQSSRNQPRTHGGTGLGLAICREIIEAANGTLSCTSTVGKGTTFTVRLSLVPTEAQETPEVDPTHTDVSQLRVLVAEDSPVNQMVLRKMLEKLGIDPMIVSDGIEVLTGFSDRAWDIVFLDMRMPRMEGPEVARQLRQQGFRGPICGLTANALRTDVDECIEAGMDRVLLKPVTLDLLHRTLATLHSLSTAEAGLPGPQNA